MATKNTYFFIGINGIGMSGLAKLLISQGHCVLGSDSSPTLCTETFKTMGIDVFNTHSPSNIQDSHWIVVVSSAIQPSNPDLITAKNMGCTIIKRGELLAKLLADFPNTLAVVGTHGKTTTSSLLVNIFSDYQPTAYFVGGQMADKPHAKWVPEARWFITELDESDGSFLAASVNNAVITNIEHEHIDFYPSKTAMVDAFESFLTDIIQKKGHCAINLDDPISKRLIKKINSPNHIITYGIDTKDATIRAESIQYNWHGLSFDLLINQACVETVSLPLFGQHNVYNALSAIAIAIQNNVPLKHILNGLSQSNGVKRRLELKYQGNGITLYDDYAHHPTEIITTLEGLYKSFSNHRIITIFQPHRYSRLANLIDGFSTAFNRSSKTIVVPVYGAGESVENHGISSIDLTEKINKNGGNAIYTNTFDSAVESIANDLAPNDIIIIMGAGNITQLSPAIISVIQHGRIEPSPSQKKTPSLSR